MCPASLCLCRGAPPRLCHPFPRPRSSRNTDAFLCQRCWISSPDVPHVPPGTLGGCSCGEGAAGRAGTPRQPPGNQGLSPQPQMCGGQLEVPHVLAVLILSVVMLLPGRDGQGEARRRKLWEAMWMCPGADAATFPDFLGGWQGLSPPGGTCCPPLHIPGACNVQRKPKKPAVGGMEEGSAGDPLSRLSSCGSKPIGGPSLPCSPPSARRCPASALLLGGL